MTRLVRKLRHEPVAFWGGLLAALLAVLTYLGVNENLLGLVGTVATLIGIPVVRSQVTPVAATDVAADGEAGMTVIEACVVIVTVSVAILALVALGWLPR